MKTEQEIRTHMDVLKGFVEEMKKLRGGSELSVPEAIFIDEIELLEWVLRD